MLKKLILTIFVIVFLINLLPGLSTDEEKVIVIYFSLYKNDTFLLKYLGIEVGTPTTFINVSSNYWLRLLSKDGRVLYFVYLPVTFEMTAEIREGPTNIIVDKFEAHYRLPWSKDASKLQIFHNNLLLFSGEIPREGCGDGRCNVKIGESYLTCPQDCPSGSKDGYCDGIADGICDPDCKAGEDPDCGKKPYLAYFFILILAMAIVFYLLRKIKAQT